MKGVVISLCDLSGYFVDPWVKAGYRAILVDPQHGTDSDDGKVFRIAKTVLDAAAVLGDDLDKTVFVAGFPPCTDVAVSGAAHFEKKRLEDPHFQAKAALVAEQCRMVGALSGAPWLFENPVSVFSSIFGPPDHTFHPYEYGGYLAEDDKNPLYPEHIPPRDAYPKKTCLWTGNGFVMPPKSPVFFGGGYSKMHTNLGGKSLKTKNIRSATPRGFAQAVFMANVPEAANDNKEPL